MQNQSNRRLQQEDSTFARFCEQLVDAKRSLLRDLEGSIDALYHADPGHSLPDLASRPPVERCKRAAIHVFPSRAHGPGGSGDK